MASEARARSVVNALAAGGVNASRLVPVGVGQDRPVADNRTEEGRAKNRRVEIEPSQELIKGSRVRIGYRTTFG